MLLSPQLKKKRKNEEKLRTNKKNISTGKKNRKEIIPRDFPPLKKHNYTQETQSNVLIFYLIRCWNWTTCILSKRDKTIRNCGVKTALYLKRNITKLKQSEERKRFYHTRVAKSTSNHLRSDMRWLKSPFLGMSSRFSNADQTRPRVRGNLNLSTKRGKMMDYSSWKKI